MNFFNKNIKRKVIKEKVEDVQVEVLKDLKVSDLFWRTYGIQTMNMKKVTIEVYQESKVEKKCDLPVTSIGIRIFEDDTLKENIQLLCVEDFGLFSYTTVQRNQTNMKFAINMADFIESSRFSGGERYGFELEKRFVSEKHIYLLDVPNEYTVNMPETDEHLETLLNFEVKKEELLRNRAMNPEKDITDAIYLLEKEETEYMESKWAEWSKNYK